MFTNLISCLLISSALGIGATNIKENPNINNDDINYAFLDESSSEEVSYPIYNDAEYKITLSEYQLNNYTFNNLLNTILEVEPDFTQTDCFLDDEPFSYYDYDNVTLEYKSGDNYRVIFDVAESYPGKFIYHTNEDVDFEYPLEWQLTVHIYSTIKSAIQADIQANEGTPVNYQDILTSMITLLTGAISSMALGIGTGVQSLVTQLFITNGSLSVFGAVVCIFGGIALAVGLSRLIFYWIEKLGNR